MKYLVPMDTRQISQMLLGGRRAVTVLKRKPRVSVRQLKNIQRNFLSSEQDAQVLRLASPAYWTAAGRQTFTLERLDVGRQGRVVGIFKCRYYHPLEGRYVTDRFLYGVYKGAPKQLKELPRMMV